MGPVEMHHAYEIEDFPYSFPVESLALSILQAALQPLVGPANSGTSWQPFELIFAESTPVLFAHHVQALSVKVIVQ